GVGSVYVPGYMSLIASYDRLLNPPPPVPDAGPPKPPEPEPVRPNEPAAAPLPEPAPAPPADSGCASTPGTLSNGTLLLVLGATLAGVARRRAMRRPRSPRLADDLGQTGRRSP
ncbi:MAG: hypothetical protein K0S65_3055, partial [Labilithrix sp.]|nr:hypothetical protein [Labilithrix sp.]